MLLRCALEAGFVLASSLPVWLGDLAAYAAGVSLACRRASHFLFAGPRLRVVHLKPNLQRLNHHGLMKVRYLLAERVDRNLDVSVHKKCDEQSQAKADHPRERIGNALVDQDGHADVSDHRVNQIERETYVCHEIEDLVVLESVPKEIARPEQRQCIGVVLHQRPEKFMFIERVDRYEQD